MKFNEKLMELRKKEGLSQEELGYKLNVTRQTVSKWELGQTTPEMDKLVEMSKIFNISVDDLVSESEIESKKESIIEDQPIQENKNKNKKIVIILLVVVIAVILMIVAPMMIFNKVANNIMETPQKIFEYIFGMFDKIEEKANNQQNDLDDIYNTIKDSQNKVIESSTEEEADEFNVYFEMLSGRQGDTITLEVLDMIIANNKKEDRKITVKYMEIETQNTDEIKDIKLKIGEYDDYEISYDYDEEGFINKVTIEKVANENSQFVYDTKELINNIKNNFEDFQQF